MTSSTSPMELRPSGSMRKGTRLESPATNAPDPWRVVTRPSARSAATASRTTVRLTPMAIISSCSVGSRAPGANRPLRICAGDALHHLVGEIARPQRPRQAARVGGRAWRRAGNLSGHRTNSRSDAGRVQGFAFRTHRRAIPGRRRYLRVPDQCRRPSIVATIERSRKEDLPRLCARRRGSGTPTAGCGSGRVFLPKAWPSAGRPNSRHARTVAGIHRDLHGVSWLRSGVAAGCAWVTRLIAPAMPARPASPAAGSATHWRRPASSAWWRGRCTARS